MTTGTIELDKPITRLDGSSATRPAPEQYLPHDSQSYVCGPSSPSLSRKTVWQVLQQTALQHGSRDAAVFCQSGMRLSWAELLRKVDDMAAGLLALGLGRGDRLAIWSPNNEAWLLTQFASARIGVILVTVNPAYRTAELEYVLNKTAAQALLVASCFKSSDYLAMLREIAPELDSERRESLHIRRLSRLRHVIQIGGEPLPAGWRFDELLRVAGPAARRRLDAISASLDPDDPINIQFTSGTTGAPKGATLTHYNIVNNARFTVDRLALGVRDRLCIPVPLYHCFGMVMGTLGAASCGCCMVFPAEAFDPAETLLAIDRERCTALYGVPTMFVAMLDDDNFADVSLDSLRTGIMAGAPCPVEIMNRVILDMHMHEVTIAYGMTETSPVSFQSHGDDPIERRVGTVGRIQPHTEVKIIDKHGAIVAPGEQGELCTRGYLVMQGYWRDEAASRASIDAAGWMHSGDLACIDADGYCSITGRVKDMIIRGGENIYPAEIEEFLFTHPDIQQAQVFGLPDARYGESVCAWLVLQPGCRLSAEQVQAYCRGRIAHYKVPEKIVFKTSLPMTITGKPQKFAMREEMLRNARQ